MSQSVSRRFTDEQYAGLCHICRRELEGHKPREVTVHREQNGSTPALTSETKGIGTCPEHSVSYDHKSMPNTECDRCACSKADCPVCREA
jgi:hypothetical protein